MRKGLLQIASEEEAPIDLTPMLDVVFIMLIFFVVSASFIKPAGVEVDRPEAEMTQSVENVNILIAITKQNEIWVDQRRIDVLSVQANLASLHAAAPQSALVIQADEDANVKTLTAVIDAARSIGINDVSVATNPPR